MMKKMITLCALAIIILLTGCFDFQFGNSVKGNWVLIGFVDKITHEDTTQIRGEYYNPELDHYSIASIFKITNNELISYYNKSDLEYGSDTLISISVSNDSIYLIDFGHGDSMAIAYYFDDDNNMVWITGIDENYIGEIHFQKYKGIIPPDSWINPLEEDDYEPDNIISHASDLSLGVNQAHTLTENDTDYSRFQAQAGTSYLIQGLAYFEMEMYLYNKHGDSLAFDDDNDLRIDGLGDEAETVILWTCNETDDYYSMIMPGNRFPWNDYQGYYQILVTEVDTNDIEYKDPSPIFIYKKGLSGGDIIKRELGK